MRTGCFSELPDAVGIRAKRLACEERASDAKHITALECAGGLDRDDGPVRTESWCDRIGLAAPAVDTRSRDDRTLVENDRCIFHENRVRQVFDGRQDFKIHSVRLECGDIRAMLLHCAGDVDRFPLAKGQFAPAQCCRRWPHDSTHALSLMRNAECGTRDAGVRRDCGMRDASAQARSGGAPC